jgi:putative PIN family toxin of toxin-antitoxin system
VTKLLTEHVIVTSREMLAELADVLSREKFKEVKSGQVNVFLSILVSKAVVVSDIEQLKIIAEDPDDDVVLSTAHKGEASYIVTGDKHRLNLKEFRGIRIVSVGSMLDLLRSSSP